MVGSTISHYRVTGQLGRGGMGIVYVAEDTKLDRTVALKLLPPHALASEDDRARFYREARAAAALNHPNIAHVYEIDESEVEGESRPFIALEYIDGESLADRVAKGPLALKDAISVATQVAEGLKAAHQKDIVHRDVKSGNIMLTAAGVPKILDFGLAKTAASTKLTQMGSTLGTVAYMSPEQARGEEVDLRSDVWSLGVILYEMVAGRMPFAGDYEQAVVYGILNSEPEPLTGLRTGVPMELERIVDKCLTKDPSRRYQSTTDLIVDLESVDLSRITSSYSATHIGVSGAGQAPDPGQSGVPPVKSVSAASPWLRIALPVAAVALVLGTALGYMLHSPGEPDPAPVRQFELTFAELSDVTHPVVSHDGTFMLLVAQDSVSRSLYRYELATRELKSLLPISASALRIDPDGSRVLYRDPTHIYVSPATGGTPTPVTEYGSGYPNFLPDGSIVFDRNESLWVASADGSEFRPVSRVDSASGEGGHYNPWPLPGGRSVLFHVTRVTGEGRQLAVLDLDSGQHRLIGPGASPRFVPSGHVLYVDGEMSAQGRVMIRPMNPESAEWLGPAVTLSPGAHIKDFAVDEVGTLYWVRRPRGSSAVEPGWIIMLNMNSRDEQPVRLARAASDLRVSPYDSLLAYSYETGREGRSQLAILDVSSGVEQRVAPGVDIRHSAWAADGRHVYFARTDRTIQKWSIETLQPVETIETSSGVGPFDVSPDGRFVAYVVGDGSQEGSLRLLDLEDGRERRASNQPAGRPRFSADGRHIAYTSMPAGSPPQVLVYSIDEDRTTLVSGEFESASGADWWREDYLYMTVDGTDVARIPVTTDPVFRPAGRAELLMSMAHPFTLDVGADNSVMYFDRETAGDQTGAGSAGATLDVTVNWSTEARRLAPVAK